MLIPSFCPIFAQMSFSLKGPSGLHNLKSLLTLYPLNDALSCMGALEHIICFFVYCLSAPLENASFMKPFLLLSPSSMGQAHHDC